MADNWLKNLKEGDAAVYTVGSPDFFRTGTVASVEADWIALHTGDRFDREDGWVEGLSQVFHLRLVEPTQERLDFGRKRVLVCRLSAMHYFEWSNLPLFTLEAVVSLLDKEQGHAVD